KAAKDRGGQPPLASEHPFMVQSTFPLKKRQEEMRMSEKVELWVVYKMTLHNKQVGVNAICEQGEWDAMERARPGYHTLVQAGITNEGEAERLARGTSGDSVKRPSREAALAQPSGSPTPT